MTLSAKFLSVGIGICSLLFAASGCATFSKAENAMDAVANYLALMAPESADAAITGHKRLESKVVIHGEIEIEFVGLWLDGDVLRAESIRYKGISINYETSPFAWKVNP